MPHGAPSEPSARRVRPPPSGSGPPAGCDPVRWRSPSCVPRTRPRTDGSGPSRPPRLSSDGSFQTLLGLGALRAPSAYREVAERADQTAAWVSRISQEDRLCSRPEVRSRELESVRGRGARKPHRYAKPLTTRRIRVLHGTEPSRGGSGGSKFKFFREVPIMATGRPDATLVDSSSKDAATPAAPPRARSSSRRPSTALVFKNLPEPPKSLRLQPKRALDSAPR